MGQTPGRASLEKLGCRTPPQLQHECKEPTSCLVQPIGAHCCEVMYFGCFGFRGEFGFLNCDDVCMWVVNKQFEHLEFVSEFMLTCMMRFLSLLLLGLCVCSPVVVLGLFVKLS